MLSSVSDCDVVISAGMGRPMYDSARPMGKQVYITRIRSPDEAVRAFAAGTLDNHPEFLH